MYSPNVFTGQPTVATGIVQHQPQYPNVTPGYNPQLAAVAPWVMPFWMKLASGAALLTGIGILIAITARD